MLRRGRNVEPLAFTGEFMRRLEQLTVEINAAIKPVSDFDLYGVDECWT